MLSGRFMYGPLDVVTLTGEKVRTQKPCRLVPRPQLLSSEQLLIPGGCALTHPSPTTAQPLPSSTQGPHGPPAPSPLQVDVYIMTQPLSGKWIHFGTEVTNSSGRLTFAVPPERALGIGVYPVRMVVR